MADPTALPADCGAIHPENATPEQLQALTDLPAAQADRLYHALAMVRKVMWKPGCQ